MLVVATEHDGLSVAHPHPRQASLIGKRCGVVAPPLASRCTSWDGNMANRVMLCAPARMVRGRNGRSGTFVAVCDAPVSL